MPEGQTQKIPLNLEWIAYEHFQQAIDNLLTVGQSAKNKASQKRVKNVIDPFSSLFIASTFAIEEPEKLVSFQDAESALRGMSNAMGNFHQNILGSLDGWVNHDAGYDLECKSRKIIAEVKNKHNTMNMSNKREVLEGLRTALRQKKGTWEAHLVQIIPRKPVRETKQIEKNLYEIDGASFYHLATGHENSIHDLFFAMCDYLSPSEQICEHCKKILVESLPPKI